MLVRRCSRVAAVPVPGRHSESRCLCSRRQGGNAGVCGQQEVEEGGAQGVRTDVGGDDAGSRVCDPHPMTSSALSGVSGSLLLAAGSAYLWVEAWAAEGFQRSAASLVAFAGVVLIVRAIITMEPRLRNRYPRSTHAP